MRFEKLHELKRGKHAVTGLCMALGITLLSSAVYASYDDANGYQNYKEAVKRLAFREKNVTAEISAKIYADEKELLSSEAKLAVDGNNYSSKGRDKNFAYQESPDDMRDDIYIEKNGQSYDIDNINKNYMVYTERMREHNGLFDFPDLESDPSAEKAVRFFELAFDAFVGDIKNNVVLESKEDGIRNYTVSASEVQIPEVINAGVALFGTYGIFGRNTDYVVTRYEDYDAAKRAYYKQKTGNDLPLDYYDSEKSEEIEKVLEGFYDLEMPYENKNGGVLVVYKDASTKYYSSFAKAMDDPANVNIFNPDDYISRFMGQDAWIKSGTNDFSIDEKGRLVSSDFTIVFATRDTEGVEHEIKVVLNAKFSDYGTTQIEMPDLEGYTKIKETEEKDTVMPFDEDTAKAKPED